MCCETVSQIGPLAQLVMSTAGEREEKAVQGGSPQGLAKRFFNKFVRRSSSPANASSRAGIISFSPANSNTTRRRSWSQRLRSRRVSSNDDAGRPADDDFDYGIQEPAKTPSRLYSKSVYHSPAGNSSGAEEEVQRGAGFERRTRSVDDVLDTGVGARRGRVRKGRWKLGNRIAKGSFGTVFMGLNEVTGELIAVKVTTVLYHTI
jgi:hypothetical protein